MSALANPLDDPIYVEACTLAMKGYKLVRLRPRSKVPYDEGWPSLATNDAVRIDEWFANDGGYNLGLACGTQPNGRNIVAIDIDTHHGGDATWGALIAQHGKVGGVRHVTPHGGSHLVLAFPEGFRNTRNRLGPGIDTRGEGGQIVLPPSVIVEPESGELLAYGCPPGRGLSAMNPIAAPDWLVEALTAPPPTLERSINRHPSTGGTRVNDDETPFDYLRRTTEWASTLEQFGWQFHSQHGEQTWWTRPGKSTRAGHSAVLHDGGPLVIFTTEIPPALEQVGRPTADGTGVTVSLPELIAAYTHGGDLGALSRDVRREMPQRALPALPPAVLDDEEEAMAVSADGLHLPDDFWLRDDLQRIFLAAKASRVSPEAMLVHVLARFSASIHPQWILPGLGTLDFMGVVLASSGGNKSLAEKYARKLWPGPVKPGIQYDQGIGSGEGLVEAFMVSVPDPDDPKKRVRKVGRQAVHFVVDESMGLLAQAGREGATIIPTLCSAWTGAALGQRNADSGRDRYVPPMTVRVAAAMAMQEGNAPKMYADHLRVTGFTGRMIFVTAYDEDAPRAKPTWPGLLELPNWADPPTYISELRFPDEVEAEIDAEHFLVTTRQYAPDERQSQRNHQRRKVAGLLAMMDGRTTVSLDDWRRANQVAAVSLATLDMIDRRHAESRKVAKNLTLRTQVADEVYIEDAKRHHTVTRLERWIARKVPRAGIACAALRRKADSKDRWAFDEAVDNLVADGRLTVRENHYFLP